MKRIKCHDCHCHFAEEIMYLRSNGKYRCEHCAEEYSIGLRSEPDCEDCLCPLCECTCSIPKDLEDHLQSP